MRYSDQPEADDGAIEFAGERPQIVENNLGTSRYAEVSYFLRNGNLYRRVLLIREPYDSSGGTPTALNGNTDYSGDFWNDFDYAAYYKRSAAPGCSYTAT